MANRRAKIFDWLCVIISIVILVLEFIPDNIKIVSLTGTGENDYIVRYGTFYGNPLSGGYLLKDIIIAISFFSLVFYLIVLVKSNRNMRIANLIMVILGFGASIKNLVNSGNFVTGYEITIALLFFILIFMSFVFYDKSNIVSDKKRVALNYLIVFTVGLALVFQLIPTSMQIVQQFNFSSYINFINTIHSYFEYGENWMLILGFLTANITFILLIFSLITLSKDKKVLCIVQLAMLSICVCFNITILIMAGIGSAITSYSIIIMILFIILTIIQSVKLYAHLKRDIIKSSVQYLSTKDCFIEYEGGGND